MPEEYFAINHSMSRRTPSTMDSAGILAEVVALNGSKGTIALGTGTWRIDLSTVIPSNARLVVEQGAMLTKSGSGTLTINGPFDAPSRKIFQGFATYDVLFRGTRECVRPEWWGAVGDESASDSLASNCAIASVMVGDTNPAAGVRIASCPVVWPAGRFLLDAKLEAYSVQGLCLRGSGKESTIFIVGTAGLECALDLYGTAYSTFSDFSITTTGSGTMDMGIAVRWSYSGPAYRSSTTNTFQSILVQGRFKEAFSAPTADQTDNTLWVGCQVYGQWSSGEATWWQYGFRFGSGATSNNLIHTIAGFGIAACARGLAALSTGLTATGGSFQSCGTDLFISGPPGHFRVQGVRSEGSGRMLEAGGSGTFVATASIEDWLWATDGINPDENIVVWPYPGHISIKNLVLAGDSRVKCAIWGNVAPKKVTVTVDGLRLNSQTSWEYFHGSAGNTIFWRPISVSETDADGAQIEVYSPGSSSPNSAYGSGGAAPPASGTWVTGDEYVNTVPVELGTAGSMYIIDRWRCITGGAPGTWVECRTLTGN